MINSAIASLFLLAMITFSAKVMTASLTPAGSIENSGILERIDYRHRIVTIDNNQYRFYPRQKDMVERIDKEYQRRVKLSYYVQNSVRYINWIQGIGQAG